MQEAQAQRDDLEIAEAELAGDPERLGLMLTLSCCRFLFIYDF
jgi:hypothetical protein